MKSTTTIFSFFTSLVIFPILATALDTITPAQALTHNQTIISSGEVFELGFFSPGNSRWYVGIWYKNTPNKTIIWVANRDHPLTRPSGILHIAINGNIVLSDQTSNTLLWSSNTTQAFNTVAQLLDSGNFVLRREDDEVSEDYLWQSFDYPTDTLLPGMKLGWDSKTGLNRYLTSWRSSNDPATGDYTFKLDTQGFPEVFLMKKAVRLYRSGPWNGLRFSGVPEMKPLYFINFYFVMNPDEICYSFELTNSSLYSRLVMEHIGLLKRFTWIETSNVWNSFWYAPKDQCDDYKECGVYGICDNNLSPVCKCAKGFEPNNQQAWSLRDGSSGCVRKNKLSCGGDGFLALKNMKLPESSQAFLDRSVGIEECGKMCRQNCSCMAYSSLNITEGGSGCVIWGGDLVDMRQYAVAEGGQDLYVRVAASDSDSDLVWQQPFGRADDQEKKEKNEAAGVRGEERLLERDDSTTAAWWLVIATMTSRQIHGGSLRCYGRSCKGATRDSFVVALQRQICSRRWCDSGVCPVWYRSMGHYHGGSTRHHGSGDVGPDQRRCGDVDAAGATNHGDNGFVRCGSRLPLLA
ncbi:hypothetical protein RJ640_017566 [Escallonia rubra]|uniref:Uncharacterized protein n=1 Tax=Escallonia rubra TaxID=112253 RepID=A0AA88RL59_9ASTE|nr:hypothetical protein RJ640_017566 [Escallonia rubra]